MPRFRYKAKKNLLEMVEGEIEAESESDALGRIEAMGFFPMRIIPEGNPAETAASKIPSRRLVRVRSIDVLVFVKKLTTLTRARVELLSGLRILHEQTENPALREVILRIHTMTREGKTLSDAFAVFPVLFPPLFVHIIRAGEASGRLDSALEQISDFMSREDAMKTRIRVALAYPSLLGVVGCLSVFVLLNFVVPRLRPLLEGLGHELPWMTRAVLQSSLVLNRSWPLILVLGAGVVAACYHPRGRAFFSSGFRKISDFIPVLRTLSRHQHLVQFTRALVLLLKSGVPALTAFELAVPTMEDPVLREGLQKSCRAVADGMSVAKSFVNCKMKCDKLGK